MYWEIVPQPVVPQNQNRMVGCDMRTCLAKNGGFPYYAPVIQLKCKVAETDPSARFTVHPPCYESWLSS